LTRNQNPLGATLLALSLVLMLSGPALADCEPDSIGSGSTTVVDPTHGAYTLQKNYEVFSDVNCGNPNPVAGAFTYTYTLSVDATSQIGIESFSIAIPGAASVIDSGFVDGAGVEPTTITVNDSIIRYFFNAVNPGETSEKLWFVSDYAPGATTAGVFGQFGLDADATCVGPVVAPEPATCTIGFWKARQDEKKGVLKYFPGSDWDAVKALAVATSSVFSTEAELLAALTSTGNRSILERGKQQLAAVLLDAAAGPLFPGNTKCRAFLGENGTQIDTDGDGVVDMTLEAAITLIESNLLSGDDALMHAAQQLADDINNGIGVLRSTVFN